MLSGDRASPDAVASTVVAILTSRPSERPEEREGPRAPSRDPAITRREAAQYSRAVQAAPGPRIGAPLRGACPGNAIVRSWSNRVCCDSS